MIQKRSPATQWLRTNLKTMPSIDQIFARVGGHERKKGTTCRWGPLANIDLEFEDRMYTHPVKAGGVYELRIVLQADADVQTDRLSITALTLEFHDRKGGFLDPCLITDQPLVPDTDPLQIETLPPCDIDDQIMAGAMASRFFIAPPDAAKLRLGPVPEGISLRRLEINALNFNWASTRVQSQVAKSFERQLEQRSALLQKALGGVDSTSPAEKMLRAVPSRQLATIFMRFKPGGDWGNVLTDADLEAAVNDYQRRMSRLRAQTDQLLRVGFIGSDRGYERLDGMSELYRLRQSKAEEQLALLDLDLVVIETGLPSGSDDPDRDWSLTFSSLDGRLPDTGAALLDLAQSHDISVHLWVTVPAQSAQNWRGLAARAARVIAEGTSDAWEGVWDGIAREVHIVPQATNPAACSVGSIHARQPDLMLVPVASDIFEFPELADLISTNNAYNILLTEFRYRFNETALSLRLSNQYRPTMGDHTRSQERLFLQSASLVLLPATSLRPDEELTAMAMDAIASGAVPVLFGSPRSDNALLKLLDRVFNINDLIELQATYRIAWYHERRWRLLMRYMMGTHIWNTEHRAAMLGRDPYPDGFDTPRISSVLITKRPQLLNDCLESFRKQSWPNKELVLILNTGSVPDDLPELRENEHVMALPQAANIGECLNRAINFSTGRYWAKMDDDDFYSCTYLEETVNYYHSTQADLVGRSSTFFYFSGWDETHGRFNIAMKNNQFLASGHVSGATLTGDSQFQKTPFSFKDRNSADSNWITRVINSGHCMFCGDSTSLVVFRSKDESKHTWAMSHSAAIMNRFSYFSAGSVAERMEFTP